MAASMTILANVSSSIITESKRSLPAHLAVNLEEKKPQVVITTPAPVTVAEAIPGTSGDIPVSTTAAMQGSATSQVYDMIPGDVEKENDKASVTPTGLSKVKLTELTDTDSASPAQYFKAVHDLSTSLSRYNAAVIQLPHEHAVLVRCALASARLYFRKQAVAGPVSADWTKSGGYLGSPTKSAYIYRAGRRSTSEELDSPPCIPQIFDSLGKVARVALSAVSRHLRLRSDAFSSLLDDCPLPSGEVSSSAVCAQCHTSDATNSHRRSTASPPMEMEGGLLMLTTADSPGLEVRDSSGKWFQCDQGVGSGDLVLLVGKALNHVTAGHRQTSSYRRQNVGDPEGSSHCSLTYHLIPRAQVSLDCPAMVSVGYQVPERFLEPIPVPQFLESKASIERGKNSQVSTEPTADVDASLKAHLSDPCTRFLLEDAVVAPCGHSFGGGGLKKLIETMVCPSCDASVDVTALVPNLTLRACVAAYRVEQSAAAHVVSASRGVKRRRDRESGVGVTAEGSEGKKGTSSHKKSHKAAGNSVQQVDQPGSPPDPEGSPRLRGVQFPYAVNDYVVIKGNKRTPEKFVGRDAIITSQCLNGWYLVRTLDTGESVRLQYRSLQKSDAEYPFTAQQHLTLHPYSSAQGAEIEDSPRSRLVFPSTTSPASSGPLSSLPTHDSPLQLLDAGNKAGGTQRRNSGSGSDADYRVGRGRGGEGPTSKRRESGGGGGGGGVELYGKEVKMKGYFGGGAWEEAHPSSELNPKTKPRSPARVGKGGKEWWGEKEGRGEKKRKKGGSLEVAMLEGGREGGEGAEGGSWAATSFKLGRSSLGTGLEAQRSGEGAGSEGGGRGAVGGGGQESGGGKGEETGGGWEGGKGPNKRWRGVEQRGSDVKREGQGDGGGAAASEEWQSKAITVWGADPHPAVSVPPKKRDFGGGGYNVEGGKGGGQPAYPYPVRTFLANKSFPGSSPMRSNEAMSPPRDRPPPVLSPVHRRKGDVERESKGGAEAEVVKEGIGEGSADASDAR